MGSKIRGRSLGLALFLPQLFFIRQCYRHRRSWPFCTRLLHIAVRRAMAIRQSYRTRLGYEISISDKKKYSALRYKGAL